MRLLWILPKWPLPEIDGATKAHMALLEHWPLDIQLDLVVFAEPKTEYEQIELKKRVNFNQLLILPYSKIPRVIRVLSSLFSNNTLPSTTKRFINYKAQIKWRLWSSNQSWDVVVFDGLHPAALFYDARNNCNLPKAKKLCLRAHNVETELWKQAKQRAPCYLKWVYKQEQERMNHFENYFFSLCDLVVPVSKNDAEKISKINSKIEIQPLFIGMDWTKNPKSIDSTVIELLFVGRLDWYPNAEGLQWFLDRIWPKLMQNRDKTITLHVIASVISRNWLRRLNNTKNLYYHGKVVDLSPFYHKASLSIIPILTGSGTRVKAIESAQFGRSFISTSLGIEGLELSPGTDFLEANTEEEWINALSDISLETCTKLGNRSFEKMKKTYDRHIIQSEFIRLLKKL